MVPTIHIPARVLVLYAEADDSFLDALETHLRALERDQLIAMWSVRSILPGDNRNDAFANELGRAHLILPLLSADFVASDACWNQLTLALARRETGDAWVVPIRVRPVDLPAAGLGNIEALPGQDRFIGTGTQADEAWAEVAKRLRKLLEDGLASKPAPKTELPAANPHAHPKANSEAAALPHATSHLPAWLVPAGFALGVAGCIALLVIASNTPEPSTFQYLVFRTLLSLSGAAFSMALTGMLLVHIALPAKGYVMGGGTMAVFVVLYFFSPALLPTPTPAFAEPAPSPSTKPTPPTPETTAPPTAAPTVTPTAAPTAPPTATSTPAPRGVPLRAGAPSASAAPAAQSRCKPGTIRKRISKEEPETCGEPPAKTTREGNTLTWTIDTLGLDGGATFFGCLCTAADATTGG